MAIESLVIYESAVYWTYVLLAILILVKLVMFVMSFGGFVRRSIPGGGSGGGSGDGNSGSGGGGSGGNGEPEKPAPPPCPPPVTPKGLSVVITEPKRDAPDPAAQRTEGDAKPMELSGKITGPSAHYDYLWGIYNGKGALVVKLACAPNIASGTEVSGNLDFTKAPLSSGKAGQLPHGTYWVYLMAQLPGSKTPEAPKSCLAPLPPEIIGAARRQIQILSQGGQGKSGANAFIIKAQNPVPGRDHMVPLDAPFGSLPTILSASASHQELGFDVKKLTGKQGKKTIRVIFYSHPGQRRQLAVGELAALGIKNVRVNFADGKGIVSFRDNFYEEDIIKDKSRINVVFDYAAPAGNKPRKHVLLAFIALYDFQAVPGMAFTAADDAMISHLLAGSGATKGRLEGMKMLDFNFDGVVLR